MLRLLSMIAHFLGTLFGSKPAPAPTLPYPEEAADPAQTIENVDKAKLVNAWMQSYSVPTEFRGFWADLNLLISYRYAVPGATDSATKTIWLRPKWANPGVLAHEAAHISYWHLPEHDKTAFAAAFAEVRNHPSIELIRQNNGYLDTSPIEGHADVYRYLGKAMPKALLGFYPYLLMAG